MKIKIENNEIRKERIKWNLKYENIKQNIKLKKQTKKMKNKKWKIKQFMKYKYRKENKQDTKVKIIS